MSQISKVDTILQKLSQYRDETVTDDEVLSVTAAKQELLSIILEARPADNDDGNGFQAGHWAALAEWEDNIKKVFGVEE